MCGWYSQVPNKRPPRLLIFKFFQSPGPYFDPPFINFKEIDFFYKSSFHFLSLLVLVTLNFHGKMAYCCIYVSFMLYNDLFLFFSSLYKQSKPFLKFRPPPVYFNTPVY